MTTLNTIIEEESNALEKKIGNFTFNNGGALELTLWDIVDERVHETDEVGTVINDHLTTAMQRAYEVGVKEEGERIDTKLNMLLDYPLIHRDMRQALNAIKDTFELNQDKK